MMVPMIVLIAVSGKQTKLERTLLSVQKCTKPQNFKEVIIVENGGKYEAERIVNTFKQQMEIRYFYNERGNKSAALNYALTLLANNTFVFFTDDDVYLDKDLLLQYYKKSKGLTNGFFFGGPVLVEYEVKPHDWLIDLFPSSAKGWRFLRGESKCKFLGANWAAFSNDLKNAGYFNVNLGPGTKPRRTGQEWDMQLRLYEQNAEAIFIDNAKVWHYVPKNRSTLKWLLQRRHQDGISQGFTYKGYRLKAIFSFFLNLLQNLLKVSFYPFVSKKKKATLIINLYFTIGKLKGLLIKPND